MADAERVFRCTLEFYSPVEIDEGDMQEFVEIELANEFIPRDRENKDWGMNMTRFSCDPVEMKTLGAYHNEYPEDGWEPPGNREAKFALESGTVESDSRVDPEPIQSAVGVSTYELGIDYGFSG